MPRHTLHYYTTGTTYYRYRIYYRYTRTAVRGEELAEAVPKETVEKLLADAELTAGEALDQTNPRPGAGGYRQGAGEAAPDESREEKERRPASQLSNTYIHAACFAAYICSAV